MLAHVGEVLWSLSWVLGGMIVLEKTCVPHPLGHRGTIQLCATPGGPGTVLLVAALLWSAAQAPPEIKSFVPSTPFHLSEFEAFPVFEMSISSICLNRAQSLVRPAQLG